jgi:hypothetical protein
MSSLYRLRAFTLLLIHAVMLPAADIPSPNLPKWMEASVEVRGRFESHSGLDFVTGRDDTFYLHRVRAHVAVKPAPWLKFYIMGQESLAPERRRPVPTNVAEGTDIYQAYVEIAGQGERHWGVRAGRQEFSYGAEKLIGRSNWGNTGRSFDSVRLYYETPDTQAEWFAGTLASFDAQRINRFTTATQLHGMHITNKSWVPRATLQPYLFLKVAKVEPGETGRPGRTELYNFGARIDGKLPRRWDYLVDTTFQRGTSGGETLEAWSGTYQLGRTLTQSKTSPRVLATYSRASGDRNRGDGRRGTFDHLYPTNHQYYGLSDRVQWRNQQEALGVFMWTPVKRLTCRFEYHSIWLATRKDSYYDFSGRPFAFNPRAGSNHLYEEPDVQFLIDATKRVQILAIAGYVFPGGFLKDSTPGAGGRAIYLQWRYLFQ